jgi:hypothetical protein
MSKRTMMFFLLLTLVFSTVACSAKPSEKELNKLFLNRLQQTLQREKDVKNIGDKFFYYVNKPGGFGRDSSVTFYYIAGSEIIKKTDDATLDLYPYIGKVYLVEYGQYVAIHKEYDQDKIKALADELYKMSLIKLKELSEKSYSGFTLQGYDNIHLSTFTYAWGKKSKKWHID